MAASGSSLRSPSTTTALAGRASRSASARPRDRRGLRGAAARARSRRSGRAGPRRRARSPPGNDSSLDFRWQATRSMSRPSAAHADAHAPRGIAPIVVPSSSTFTGASPAGNALMSSARDLDGARGSRRGSGARPRRRSTCRRASRRRGDRQVSEPSGSPTSSDGEDVRADRVDDGASPSSLAS